MRKLAALGAIVAMLGSPVGAAAPDLSPGHWPEAERAKLEAREAGIWPQAAATLNGTQVMVSATASPVAVHAGIEALRQGGTAADAAVTTALTQVTMMLGANVSFAGVAELLYYDAASGRVFVMDAGWNGWRGETDPKSIPAADISMITGKAAAGGGAAGRKTMVPGFMAGMAAMHARFGRLAWPRLFDPAIWYAEQGVPVTGLLAAYFGLAEPALGRTAEGRAFLHPDGKAAPAFGSRFVVPGLAATLRAAAASGGQSMYKGDWARAYVAAVKANGGAAKMADMAAYRASWTEPMRTPVAGGTVYAPDAANPNGCSILMALNLLGQAGPGAKYWQDAKAFRRMAVTLRASISAPFSPEVAGVDAAVGKGSGCAAHSRPDWGAAAAARIEALGGVSGSPEPGHHSASVVVVDRWGNVAALVHSSNTPIWGDTGMIVGGVPVPTPAGLYQARLAGIAPGARLPGDMAPLMLLKGGRPALAIASIGTSLVPESVRLMLGLGQGGDPVEWEAAPPLIYNFEQVGAAIAARDALVPEGGYTPAMLEAMRAAGIRPRAIDSGHALTLRGTAAVVRIDHGARTAAEVPGVLEFGEGE